MRSTLTCLILAASLIPPAAAQTSKALVDNSASPYAKLKSVDFDSVSLTGGFWEKRFGIVRDTSLPVLYDRAVECGAVKNLEIAAGLKQGEYNGNNWMDAWLYKWLEAAAAVYSVTKDEELARRMDDLIAIIAKAQEPDGFVATQITVPKKRRFQDTREHEVYTMGHLMTAASIHHRLTGKDNMLRVARNAADFLAAQYKGKNPKMAHFPYNPSVIMGAAEMYRTTRDPRYLQLANNVIDMRGAFKGGTDINQNRVPLRDEKEVFSHAVFYTYLFGGAADAYMEAGDPSLLSALNRLWGDLVAHKLYITGGTCAIYRSYSFRGRSVWGSDSVHEAVGLKYQLPKWAYSHLYNEMTDAKPTPIDIKLIPYYAWNNRGVSKMSVWLPVDW